MRELRCCAVLLCSVSGKRQEFSGAGWGCVFLNSLFKTTFWNHCVFSLATEEWNPSVPRRGSVKKKWHPLLVLINSAFNRIKPFLNHCRYWFQLSYLSLQKLLYSFLSLEHSDRWVKIYLFSSIIKTLCLSFYPWDYVVAVLQKPDVRIRSRTVLLWEWQLGVCSQDRTASPRVGP